MASLIDYTIKNSSSTLNTSRNVKPDKPKGHLVDTPLYAAPVEYFKDLATDTYGIVKGLNGKANDHELGKQNDVAMKLGSLAIAAYLMSFRKTKLPKIMELVGFGSFFTSMALWPKLAISMPLKMRTGVDMQQKYVDSYGRKKNFFQDSQYLPWDLYSDEKLKNIGDKMGVPYDVPNREEVIKEKARKLAVQGHTLWMATAGFATPVMTALICNRLEPTVESIKQKMDLKNTQKAMDSQSWFASSMAAPKQHQKAFDEFLASNMGSKLATNEELIKKMNWSENISPLMGKYLDKDLDKILSNVKNDITPEYVDSVFNTFSEPLKQAGVDKEVLNGVFKENGLFGNQTEFVTRFKNANPKSSAESLQEATKEILMGLVDKKAPTAKEEIKALITDDKMANVVKSYNRKVLDKETVGHLRKVFNEMSNYFNREQMLTNWMNARVADSADSMSAHSWKKVTKEIFKTMGMTGKDLETLELEGSKSRKLFVQKIDEVVSDPKKYKKVISSIAEKIAEFDNVATETSRQQYAGYVDTMCDLSQNAFKKLGFSETAAHIGGREFIKDASGKILNEQEALSGSLRNLKRTTYDFRVLGERASFYRFIQTLDLYKRMKDGTFEGQFEVITKNANPKAKPNYESVIKKAKETLMSSGSAEHTDKLNFKGPTNTYKTIMRLLFGALPDDYVSNSMIDLSSDVLERRPVWEALESGTESGYKAAVKAGFDKVQLNRARTGMAQDTIEALYDASVKFNKKNSATVDLVDNMKTYMKTFIDKVVNFNNGRVKNFDLLGQTDISGAMSGLPGNASPGLKHSLIGLAPEELVRKSAQELSNTRKWFKMFGIGGAILLTGTVLSTLFFGHIPQKEMYMRNGNNK